MITFEAIKTIIGNKAEVSGNFRVKMTQFKIEPPSMMGMAADDEIKISFKLFY